MRNLFTNVLYLLAGFGADIVTVTTGTAGNVGNVAADLQTYFAAKLLEVAELVTILDQFGKVLIAELKLTLNTLEVLYG